MRREFKKKKRKIKLIHINSNPMRKDLKHLLFLAICDIFQFMTFHGQLAKLPLVHSEKKIGIECSSPSLIDCHLHPQIHHNKFYNNRW